MQKYNNTTTIEMGIDSFYRFIKLVLIFFRRLFCLHSFVITDANETITEYRKNKKLYDEGGKHNGIPYPERPPMPPNRLVYEGVRGDNPWKLTCKKCGKVRIVSRNRFREEDVYNEFS